jgi:hypothetical protein
MARLTLNIPITDVPLIRLAEMYLIKSEANFRATTFVGNTPVADINLLRTRKCNKFPDCNLSYFLRERIGISNGRFCHS